MDRQQADQRREMELEEALDEAWQQGLSPKAMEVLLFETGASFWKPKGQHEQIQSH